MERCRAVGLENRPALRPPSKHWIEEPDDSVSSGLCSHLHTGPLIPCNSVFVVKRRL